MNDDVYIEILSYFEVNVLFRDFTRVSHSFRKHVFTILKVSYKHSRERHLLEKLYDIHKPHLNFRDAFKILLDIIPFEDNIAPSMLVAPSDLSGYKHMENINSSVFRKLYEDMCRLYITKKKEFVKYYDGEKLTREGIYKCKLYFSYFSRNDMMGFEEFKKINLAANIPISPRAYLWVLNKYPTRNGKMMYPGYRKMFEDNFRRIPYFICRYFLNIDKYIYKNPKIFSIL